MMGSAFLAPGNDFWFRQYLHERLQEESMKTQELDDMNSGVRNAHSAFLSPVYFPSTFMSPSLVEAMSLCFHRVVVYHPAYSKPQEGLRPWIDGGFLDVRSPFEGVVDKKPLEAALRNFRSWGHLHQHRDMAYLKMVGNKIAPVDPKTSKIVSDIKAIAEDSSKEPEESELSVQLFIHLAQEFDEHSWELRQQMNRFNDQYLALQSSFREDQTGQAHEPTPRELFHVMGEDPGSLMLEKRMAAWNHLFQKDPADASLLFTDSPSALAHILDRVQEKAEVLKFNVTYTHAESVAVHKDYLSWADYLHEIFNIVLTTPWDRTLEERVVEAGRKIEAGIDHFEEPTGKPHDRSASFQWYVLPHQIPRTLLNRCCGVGSSREENEVGKVRNTMIGLIQPGGPTVF
jgi:hypothetical protein